MIPSVTLEQLAASPVIAEAMATHGCCLIKDAFTKKRMDRLLEHARTTLDLPEEALLPYRRTHATGGYVPPGMEYVRGDAAKCRMFDLVALDHGNTVFPPDTLRFEVAMRGEYYSALTVALLSLRAMDAAWNTSLELDARKGPHMLRALAYDEGSAERFPEHRDFGLVSVFVAESSPGLECLVASTWTQIAVPSGSALLIAGTALRLYNTSVRPLAHRVLGGRARTSMVFFVEARGDVILPNGERASERLARRLHGALRVPS